MSVETPGCILSDDFNGRHPGPSHANAKLTVLLSPVAAVGLWSGGRPAAWLYLAALAAAATTVVALSAFRRRRALLDLDWLPAAILSATLLMLFGLAWPAGLASGFLAGVLITRPWMAKFLGGPGCVSLMAALAGGVLAGPWLFPVTPADLDAAAAWPLAAALGGAGLARIFKRLWLVILPIAAAGFLAASPPPAADAAVWGLIFFLAFFVLPYLAWPLAAWLSETMTDPEPAEAVERPKPPSSSARARLRCGHQGAAPRLARWQGPPSCRLAAAHDDGPLACPYGCLGLGDCLRACPHQAISLSDQGFPIIDPGLCRGCGACREACPKNLVEMAKSPARAFIPCASLSGLKENAAYCDRSCLGCGRCRKACPARAIGRRGDCGAMAVDQKTCWEYGSSCGEACLAACPRQIIRPRPGQGSPEGRPAIPAAIMKEKR